MLKEQVLVRSKAVVARVVAGETLIVPIRAKVGDLASIYSFNGTGSLIWKLLESAKTVEQLRRPSRRHTKWSRRRPNAMSRIL